MIMNVETHFNHNFIADLFWRQNIAKVSLVTLVPYLKNEEVFYIAYITIGEWFNNIIAYNFMEKLMKEEGEARLIYEDENWWPVQINRHNDGTITVGAYTVQFTNNYFDRYEQEVADIENALNEISQFFNSNEQELLALTEEQEQEYYSRHNSSPVGVNEVAL